MPQNCAVAWFCGVISTPSPTHMCPSNGRVDSSSTPLYALLENVKTMISIVQKIRGCATYMAMPLYKGRTIIAISRKLL